MAATIDDTKFYKGNKRLKACGVTVQFSPVEVEEYIKCAQDPVYFIETYCKIETTRGERPFILRQFQKDILKLIHENRFVIINCARQIGKSQILVIYYLWCILFNKSENIGLFGNKLSSAKTILKKVQYAYERLPFWLQQGVKEWSKTSLELENDSKCFASSTTESSGRSGTLTRVLLDEFAFVHRNVAEEFYTSVFPTISSDPHGKTKFTIISTPNGMNHFYYMWKEANVQGPNKKSNFLPYLATWRAVPERTEEWKVEEIKNLGSEARFSQEHECEFLGGENTLINPNKLKAIPYTLPLKSYAGMDMYNDVVREIPATRMNPKATPGHVYSIIVDTAQGQELDYHAFSVIDITSVPYVQVAKYRSKTLEALAYPNVIYQAATYYNNAYVLIELNNGAAEVAHALEHDLEYEYVLRTKSDKKRGQILTNEYPDTKPGLTMSKSTKPIGCMTLKSLVENDKLIIQDFDTVAELTSFIVSKNSYAAEKGANDDLVMGLVSFAWMTNQQFFKDLTNTDLRKQIAQNAPALNESVMAPVINTGHEQYEAPIEVTQECVWYPANVNFSRRF